jgi:tRNA pseudouridine38-40 synthase
VTGKQRYFIELSFDGARYHGWQIQKNAVSVQEVLNEKLSVILRQPIETTGCGRTDTGVHARDFFAHFDAEGFMVDSSWFMENSENLERHGQSAIAGNTEATMNYEPLTMNH